MSLVLGKAPAEGRAGLTVSDTKTASGLRLVLFPHQLQFRDILIMAGSESGGRYSYLPFFPMMGGVRGSGWKTVTLLWKLWQFLEGSRRVDLIFLSPKLDWLTVYGAAVVCRLKGVSPVLHDFSFYDETAGRRRRLLRSICVISGAKGPGGCGNGLDDIITSALRSFGQSRESYRRARKDRAVPHAIIVSNGENERMTALAKRAFDLVKQKYPRTEFILTALRQDGKSIDAATDGAIRSRVITGEDDLASLFEESDIAVFLSPGGINELLVARARAAGFPIIVNGFGFAVDSASSVRPVVIPRDSYSSLAEAIIRLVDDDVYYRSFASA